MRRYYLDNIRWATILLVAVYHVIYMYNGVAPEIVIGPFLQYQDSLMYILYPWFMILLFVTAGMSSRYYLETHTVKEFVRSRTRKLLVPSTIGLLVIGWVQGYIRAGCWPEFSRSSWLPAVLRELTPESLSRIRRVLREKA